MRQLGFAFVVFLTAIGAMAPSHAAGWLEKGIYLSGPRYDGDLPACEAGLGTIASRFASCVLKMRVV